MEASCVYGNGKISKESFLIDVREKIENGEKNVQSLIKITRRTLGLTHMCKDQHSSCLFRAHAIKF